MKSILSEKKKQKSDQTSSNIYENRSNVDWNKKCYIRKNLKIDNIKHFVGAV